MRAIWNAGLLTNAIDGNTSSDPLLDLSGETSELGVSGAIEVVVVDVKLSIGSGLLGGVESDADEFLTENLREDGVAEGTVLGENLVDDVLRACQLVTREIYSEERRLTQAKHLPLKWPATPAMWSSITVVSSALSVML